MYRQIKWLILIIPTLTIGLWEYVRHEFLLSYISMDLGNLLSPVIVFVVTMLLLTRLFKVMENIQAELHQSQMIEAVLKERESLAQELHDGIAQSMFLMSVKIDEFAQAKNRNDSQIDSVKLTVHEINEYVRQAISNLRYPPELLTRPWNESLEHMIGEVFGGTNIKIVNNWTMPSDPLTVKEKMTLYAYIRESLLNIRKHARGVTQVLIQVDRTQTGWRGKVADNGSGFKGDPFLKEGSFGLTILKERALEHGWDLALKREDGWTIVEVSCNGEEKVT